MKFIFVDYCLKLNFISLIDMIRFFFFLILFITKRTNAEKNNHRPNFLFILEGDQLYDAVGISRRYPFLNTPNKESKRLQKKKKYNPYRDWWLRTQTNK